MKITFEEVLSKKEWLHSEPLSSLTGEIFTKQVIEDQFYDVKLVDNAKCKIIDEFNLDIDEHM